MDKDTTRSLSKILENMKSDADADEFIKANPPQTFSYFYEYLNSIVAGSDLKISVLITRCGISKNYVYNILNGHKKNPARDKVIALCIASEMTYGQTQRGLETAGLAPLYPKDPRDVRIAIAINQGVCNVTEVNLMLDKYNLDILDV